MKNLVGLRPGDFGRLVRGRTEHRIGKPEQHCVHDLLVGDCVGDRLADFQIVERRSGDVHADVLDAVGERQRDHVELALRLHLLEILVRQFVGDVGIAAFEQRAAVAGLRHHAPDHAPDLRQRTADPLIVALHDHFGAGGPFRHLVSAGARRLLLGVFEAPRILLRGALLHQFRIDHAGHDDCEVRNCQAVLLGEVDANGLIIDDDELFGLGERAGAHLERRKTADGHRAIERPFHVLRRHRRAVVKLGILLQFEGHRHVADIHVVGEFALELVAVVIGDAAGAALHLMADQPVVAIPRHLVAGHVGADAVDVEIVGSTFGDDQQRLGASVRLGGRDDRGRGHQGTRGQSGDGFEEVAALHGRLQRNMETGFGAVVARFVPSVNAPLTGA